ncbi:CAP domain-containing protein [Bradyrhizobium sp.]|uniref:CAP domain-containing protein n=1 Tax=Bradyrhizobium sp. TaxID=376 RepID=UPI004037C32D
MLELINAERAKVGAQPLAFDGDLNEAAEGHSQWMIGTDTFSHTGSGGSSAGQRMTAAGYSFTGSWAWGENIAWATTRSPTGLQDEVLLLHTSLMNSSGHRTNILNDNYREVGLGLEVGDYGGREGAFLTEDFARSGSGVFLTGVAFDDKDGDRFYDVGEGLGGLTLTAVSSTGATYTTNTYGSGGYDLVLPPATYTVTFSGAGIETTSMQTTVGSKNVKLDLIDPAMSGTQPPPAEPPPPSSNVIAGTASSETLNGTAGADTILGLGGDDRLYGREGNDRLEGGTGRDYLFASTGDDTLLGDSGNDYLYGGLGRDVLTGGVGQDSFVFDTTLGASNIDQITDFSVVDDTIRLDNAVFTKFSWNGTMSSSAFYIGAAAHDSTDRIIYDSSTGALSYDPDGTGSAAAVQFAELSPDLALTYRDFLIV